MPQRPESHAPLSRRLALGDVPATGADIVIAATPAECAALAELNALPNIGSFEAKFHARRWRDDGLEISGEIRARVTQNCVVTLEDFETEIIEPVSVRFAPPREKPVQSRRREDGAQDDQLSLEDQPDELIDGAVDLGAVASEFLTLALDPYPRKPGAAFVAPGIENAGSNSPFAALDPAVFGQDHPNADQVTDSSRGKPAPRAAKTQSNS